MFQPILLAAEGETYIISFAELPVQLIFHALMVLVLFFVLGKLVFKPVLKMMKTREEAIKNNIDNAEQNREEAERFKAEYQQKLDSAMKEREEILSQSYKAAQKREDEIVREARAEAERIRERAMKDLEQEEAKARDALRQETVDLASAMAEKLIHKTISEEDKAQMLEESMKEMEEAQWQK